MAERKVAESTEAAAEAAILPTDMVIRQEHTVAQGGVVTIHAGNAHVKDGKYKWHLKDPKGHELRMHNSETPEPCFVAELLGDYVAKLSAEDGSVQFTFHVTA